jgi:hypothetical protein
LQGFWGTVITYRLELLFCFYHAAEVRKIFVCSKTKLIDEGAKQRKKQFFEVFSKIIRTFT